MKRLLTSLPLLLGACAVQPKVNPVVPSLRYSDNVREAEQQRLPASERGAFKASGGQ